MTPADLGLELGSLVQQMNLAHFGPGNVTVTLQPKTKGLPQFTFVAQYLMTTCSHSELFALMTFPGVYNGPRFSCDALSYVCAVTVCAGEGEEY